MYAASRWLRIGYRIPLISTLTTRESISGAPGVPGSEVQRLDLLQHVADAAANLLALAAQGAQLGAGAFGVAQPRPRALELGAQPRVLFGGARLFGARARQILGQRR